MLWFKKKQAATRQPQLMAGQNDYVFRRSRTLTGTTSSEVTVSAQKLGLLKTDRLKVHELVAHRNRLLRLLGATLVACIVLAFLVFNFITSPTLTTGQLGARQPNTQGYLDTIYRYFGDHPLERFGFLLRAADLEAQLKREHTELSSITVSRDWYGGNVGVNLFFRQPLLSWRVSDKLYYVDGQGVAFEYSHFDDPAVTVTDQSGLPANESGVIASSRFIRFLGRMVGAVNGYGKGTVTEVVLPASTREIDVKLEGRDYVIKTNSDRDPLQQAEDVAFALAYIDQHGIKPQYIDVRVAHKAFYK